MSKKTLIKIISGLLVIVIGLMIIVPKIKFIRTETARLTWLESELSSQKQELDIQAELNAKQKEDLETKKKDLENVQKELDSKLNHVNSLITEYEEKLLDFETYKNDPNSKWFSFEQLEAIKDTGFTSDDLRYISTMVFWEVGKVKGPISVQFPEISDEWTECDPEILRILTAAVLYNRTVYSSYFNDTFYENLIRPGQYHPSYVEEYGVISTSTAYTNFYTYWENTVESCIKVLTQNYDNIVPERVIFQSNYSNLGTSYYAVVDVPANQGSTCYFAYK